MPKNILIADDEPFVRMLVRQVLHEHRHRVVEAADGAAALDLMRREPVDLLLLDGAMPVMGGLEALRVMRKEPGLASVPVIMLTARDEPADVAAAQAIGVDAYLFKPFTPAELVQSVTQVLEP